MPSSDVLLANVSEDTNILTSPTSPELQVELEESHSVMNESPVDGKENNIQKLSKVGNVCHTVINHEDVDYGWNSEQDKYPDVSQRCEPSSNGKEPIISGLDYTGLKPLQHKAVLALKCESRREAWENR